LLLFCVLGVLDLPLFCVLGVLVLPVLCARGIGFASVLCARGIGFASVLCARGIGFASASTNFFCIAFWNYFDDVVYLVFQLIDQLTFEKRAVYIKLAITNKWCIIM
jgi:hypothetical protein